MTAVREAVVLPFLLLTIVLMAGVRPGTPVELMPPSLFALLLATLLIAALVRSSATGRRHASWTFAQASAGDVVTTHVACLARNSRFG